MRWRYNDAMTSIQIKDVPEEVHHVLRRRAANEGRSLQQYLLRLLVKETSHPDHAELYERLRAVGGGTHLTFDEVTALIREDRDSH